MKQIKKTSSEYDAKEIEELKKDTKTSPVYFRTAILSGKEMGMFDAYDALTVYFHNFKITPIYPMQQGTYKQEISDIQEDSPIYSSGFRNDTGVEVFGSQTLTNSTTLMLMKNLLPYHIVMILEYLAILQQVWDLVQQKQWRKDGQKKKAKAKH